MNNMLSTSVLDSWARENPRKAQELLPELVLRLILRTSSQIADYDFPIEKGIQYSGYDGVLVSDEKRVTSRRENLYGSAVRMMTRFQNLSLIFRKEQTILLALM